MKHLACRYVTAAPTQILRCRSEFTLPQSSVYARVCARICTDIFRDKFSEFLRLMANCKFLVAQCVGWLSRERYERTALRCAQCQLRIKMRCLNFCTISCRTCESQSTHNFVLNMFSLSDFLLNTSSRFIKLVSMTLTLFSANLMALYRCTEILLPPL